MFASWIMACSDPNRDDDDGVDGGVDGKGDAGLSNDMRGDGDDGAELFPR